ncbi:hypothetical protein PCANC_00952 [Puccinia coronata f. sp. avenae]|uniref:Uncharacterized protein n=1 Tax=Puccinia coronata f. sp. avenae TaxID=200324 RepID=A0A2N5W6L5_9BASI|nr:hypothetical protein PCANC_00952 [Puccinia coronata f. sp. avenae]
MKVKWSYSPSPEKFGHSLFLAWKSSWQYFKWAWIAFKETQTAQEVTAKTVEKYLFGNQTWHEYHSTRYPKEAKTRVAILLRAAAKVDAQLPAKQRKAAVHLRYMVFLAQELDTEAEKDQAIRDLVMAAFWACTAEEHAERDVSSSRSETQAKECKGEHNITVRFLRRESQQKKTPHKIRGHHTPSESNTLSLSRSQGVSPRARAHTWPELLGLAPIPLLAVPFSLGGVSRPLEEFPSSGPGQTSIHHPLDPYPADSGARPIESQLAPHVHGP